MGHLKYFSRSNFPAVGLKDPENTSSSLSSFYLVMYREIDDLERFTGCGKIFLKHTHRKIETKAHKVV